MMGHRGGQGTAGYLVLGHAPPDTYLFAFITENKPLTNLKESCAQGDVRGVERRLKKIPN
jgi:xanthine dehydrogenase iron-sulfur cluster and FAD-binding subunit A